MIGYLTTFLALVATGIALFCYLNAYLKSSTRRSERHTTGGAEKGLLFYRMSAVLVACSALYLFYIIFSDQFQFAYVFGYSSRDLSNLYKFSAFWAGQEGSFLLWALFHVGFGLVVSRQRLCGAMIAYCVLQSMLLVTLLAKSPFMLLATPQPDGFGLNPLLKDPWMVIHPPVVFLGYAGLAVPYAYAVDGLLRRKSNEWINQALPWSLFSWAALGAGIFIGGFWAYKVLGWGGYWAWDPVENSSLVPWLACGALVHLLLLARVRQAACKPAYLAALFTFVLVMYGTFLTRSGILSDFSTHSFSDEGVGGLLACFVMITAVAALGLTIARWPQLPDGELFPGIVSREFFLAAAALVFAVIGVIVLVGMSTPLITMLLGNPQNVNTSFYNTTTLPLALLLVMLLSIGSLAGWGENRTLTSRTYLWLSVLSLVFAISLYYSGIRQPLAAAAAALSVTALVVSLYAVLTKKLTRAAGFTHAGVGIALVGILFSSVASQSHHVRFEKGDSQQVFGAKLTYLGARPAEKEAGFYQSFKLEGMVDTVLEPFTKLNKEGHPAAREPGIHRGLAGDLYLAPVMEHETNPAQEFNLQKGEEAQAGALAFKLIRYGMAGGGGSEVRVYALLTASKDGQVEEARPELVSRNGQVIAVPFKVFGQYEFRLTALSLGQGTASIGFTDLQAETEQRPIDVEVSYKPFISLVWLGTVVVTVGTALAAWLCWKKSAGCVVRESKTNRPMTLSRSE